MVKVGGFTLGFPIVIKKFYYFLLLLQTERFRFKKLIAELLLQPELVGGEQ